MFFALHKGVNVSQRLHLRRKLHWQRLLLLLFYIYFFICSFIYFTATIRRLQNHFLRKQYGPQLHKLFYCSSKNKRTKPQIQQQQIWFRKDIPQKQCGHLCGESPSATNVSTHTKNNNNNNKKQILTAHARPLSMIQHVICLSIRKQMQPRISFFKFCSSLLFPLNIVYGFPLFLSSFVSLKMIDPAHNLHNQHPRKSNRLKNSIDPTITVSRPLYYYLHKPVRRSRRHATDASFLFLSLLAVKRKRPDKRSVLLSGLFIRRAGPAPAVESEQERERERDAERERLGGGSSERL